MQERSGRGLPGEWTAPAVRQGLALDTVAAGEGSHPWSSWLCLPSWPP